MKSPKPPWTPKVPIPDLRLVAIRARAGKPAAVRSAMSADQAAQADRLLRDLVFHPSKSV